jgi:quercetin dioxygenase-like cupin family protein
MLRVTIAALLISVCSATAQAQLQPSPIKRTPVAKIDVPGSNYEVIIAQVEIAPGFKAGRHTHPGTVQVQMQDGDFWLAIDGQPEKVYKAGDIFEVPSGAVHNEGSVGDKPVKFIGTYVVEKGKPMVQPVQ